MDLQVESCATPIDTEPQVLEYWSKRIAEITWAAPRLGWQQDMKQKLREAPGIVLTVQVLKQISALAWTFPSDTRSEPSRSMT